MAMGKIRNPKSEIRKKAEARSPNVAFARLEVSGLRLALAFRISDFGLPSDFGFRISDFAS